MAFLAVSSRYRTALSERHKNISWPGFVSAVLEKDGYDNIHWTPQVRDREGKREGGMRHNLDIPTTTN